MFNLSESNISYMIISPTIGEDADKFYIGERLCSVLYYKGYTILKLKSYVNESYTQSYMCWNNILHNETLKEDAKLFIKEFNLSNLIIKYSGAELPNLLVSEGYELPAQLNYYPPNDDSRVYIHNGISFSFSEGKRYYNPTCKNDLKNGMVIEFYNKDRWIKKEIIDIDSEYEKMYKLLIKYERVRYEL